MTIELRTGPATNVPDILAIINQVIVEVNAAIQANGNADVSGPGTATLNAVPRWANTSGTVLADSLMTVDDTGHVAVIAGTSLLPSLAFTGDTTTGFFRSAAGVIGVAIEAAARFLFGDAVLNMGSGVVLGWSSTAAPGTVDTSLQRGAAGVIGVGGASASFPGLKRSTTNLQVKLADDSAFAPLAALSLTAAQAESVVGSSVALTDGAGAETATLTTAPVAGNPTKWIGINDNGTIRYVPAWNA